MSTIVAVLAIGCFVYVTLYLIMFKPLQLYSNLIKIKRGLERSGATDEQDSSDHLSKTLVSAPGALFQACLFIVLDLLSTIAEIIVITYALTNNLGYPSFGYVALGIVLVVSIVWTIFDGKRIKKNQELADSKNEEYLPKRNWFHLGLSFLVDVYCLYIFLILINLI
ncbi:MAG: hypothetical protein WA052_03985 [Microgenomates group bacterium]